MKNKKITVSKKVNGKIQYLKEILPEIPTNTILYKKLTGLGATYGELKADRNSIIIEPNKPVISGKCKDPKHKNDNLFGVSKGVGTDDIIAYMERSIKQKKHFKLLTTPESFSKVQEAFEEMEINIRFNCFLLLDECHKIIKDVDYRENITLPMDFFFECEQKALVSATPIEFTDPRFEEQNFQTITIVPTFDYSKQLNLHTTNNVLQTIKEILPTLQGNIFIFCNSTDMIYNLMKQLDLFNESAIFCSNNSVNKLKHDKEEKVKTVYEDWCIKNMKHINWFTSRFYNAVDIELENNPNVILISDCYFADFTIFDPFTDAVQAVGRFRNGIASINHITNTNKNFQIQTKEGVQGYVKGLEMAHGQLIVFRDTNAMGIRDAWQGLIEVSLYNQFLNDKKQKCYFKIDNYVNDEVVKGYYNNEDSIYSMYQQCDIFEVSRISHTYKYGDYERLKRNSIGKRKEKLKVIVEQLELIGKCETEMDFEYKQELIKADSFIVAAYDTVGKAIIEHFNYRTTPIKEAMIMKQYREKSTRTEAIQLIKNSFKEETWYADKYIKDEITRIFKMVNINYPKAVTSYTIEDFFYCDQENKNTKRGKRLHKCKF